MTEHIVAEEMIEGIALINFEWKYLYVNESNGGRERIFHDDMIGRIIFEEARGNESSIFFKLCQSVMKDRTPQHVEKEYTFTDGCAYSKLSPRKKQLKQ